MPREKKPDFSFGIGRAACLAVSQKLGLGRCEENILIGRTNSIYGGLQSDSVHRLNVEVRLVAKVGDGNLRLQQQYFDTVGSVLPSVFPQSMLVELRDSRLLLLMEDIGGESALSIVFKSPTDEGHLRALTREISAMLRVLHRLPITRQTSVHDPYLPRLRRKLEAITKLDPQLVPMWDRAVNVNGAICPALQPTLRSIHQWLEPRLRSIKPAFLHGDPHLGNIFCQPTLRPKVRFIDPNPSECLGDPLYDVGKVFHWIDAVGWAAWKPALCQARVKHLHGSGDMKLRAWLSSGASKAAERRRRYTEQEFFRAFATEIDNDKARFWLSVATAHAGLALLLAKVGRFSASRFVVARLLDSIRKCDELVRL